MNLISLSLSLSTSFQENKWFLSKVNYNLHAVNLLNCFQICLLYKRSRLGWNICSLKRIYVCLSVHFLSYVGSIKFLYGWKWCLEKLERLRMDIAFPVNKCICKNWQKYNSLGKFLLWQKAESGQIQFISCFKTY